MAVATDLTGHLVAVRRAVMHRVGHHRVAAGPHRLNTELAAVPRRGCRTRALGLPHGWLVVTAGAHLLILLAGRLLLGEWMGVARRTLGIGHLRMSSPD